MKLQNKILALMAIAIFAFSMIDTIVFTPPAKAEVINGVNYDSATATAIKAGMTWDLNANASANRLLLWNRWKDHIPTYVYLSATPNPVGVGQEMTYLFFNPQVPSPSTDKYLFTIDITQPNGEKVTLPQTSSTKSYTMALQDGKFVADTTGSCWTTWTPTQVGNHTITVKFWGVAVPHTDASFKTGTNTAWYGVTLDPSTYTTTFTVQQDPVYPTGWSNVPLPTEFWSRPIEGQNTNWYQVSSNWFNNYIDSDNGGADGRFQPSGIGPNSGHILWTKPTEDGGVVGGNGFSPDGNMYNAGHQYQTRWDGNQIIMAGKLYYRESNWYSASPGDYVCVDLQTGQEIWRNKTMSAIPSFGYMYDWDDMNQHGIVEPTWLFSNNYAQSIHPRFGITGFAVQNVPSGTPARGDQGEELRYILSSVGNSTKPLYALMQWNSSRVFISTTSGVVQGNVPITPARPSGQYWNGTMWQTSSANASTAQSYDWNVTLSNIPFITTSAPSIRGVIRDDILLVSNGTLPTAPSYTYADYATFWGISLKPGSIGQLVWGPTNIPLVTSTNQNLDFQRCAEGVFTFQVDPDMSWIAYDMHTGLKLWDSMAYPESIDNTFAYYISSTGYNPSGNSIAYGKLFSTGYVGFVYCYDLYNGTLLWKQSAPTGMEKFEYYTLMIGAIADNKIYIGTHEHSADSPLFKGAKVRCYDVNSGTLIWAMDGWANPHTVEIADGVLTYWNNYDSQVYAVGKGPSQMTVTIADDSITSGTNVVIKGTVTDISAGTKQKEQAARFPDGVPAVSDDSQSDWMAYVYMQKPRPANATGVSVTLSVVDANGNYREIGTTTANSDGFYSYAWGPDIPGLYTVYASFGGSNSYWPSHSVTAFNVDQPAATVKPTPITQPSTADTYMLPGFAAVITAIFVVGAAILLVLRKRA